MKSSGAAFSAPSPARGNGITLINSVNNTVEDNEVEDNARHGISLVLGSTDNMVLDNESKDNNTANNGGFDYNDDSTGGTGPSGSQNTYQKNKGRTQNKPGLIQKFI